MTFKATEIKTLSFDHEGKTTRALEIYRKGADIKPKISDIYHWEDNGLELDLKVFDVRNGDEGKFDVIYDAVTDDPDEYKRWQKWHKDHYKEELTVSLRCKEK